MTCSGVGDQSAWFRVFMANTPSYPLPISQPIEPLKAGDIFAIGQACGNGWRKVFNVYAKLLYGLADKRVIGHDKPASWQQFRDQRLLQKDSNTALYFAAPEQFSEQAVNIIMGRTYANSLPVASSLTWLNNEFAIAKQHNLVVCPYFDYRQLSNQKIIFLVEVIQEHLCS